MENSLFDIQSEAESCAKDVETLLSKMPLAARLRPTNFSEYIGQEHILSPGKLLRRAIDSDSFTSIILFGPPGTGKTSLAELIAGVTNSVFVRLSGVISNVPELRKEIQNAIYRRANSGKKTIVFIDEIHRFNRAQQDVLLPFIENGSIRFIGATTQNPYFYVVGPLISRSLVFRLEALSKNEIKRILSNAINSEKGFPGKSIILDEEASEFLAEICEGDARRALNALEIAALTTVPDSNGCIRIDISAARESVQSKAVSYGDDGHYDTASALIKSMRGSDPDAALYWLAKMLEAGEDISFIARRIVIFASEDIGNADPRAITLAVNAMQAVEMIGMPEARIILAQAVTYCATAPKSNASYAGIEAALDDIRNERVQPVPLHIRDSHYNGAKKLGHGEGYKYPHNEVGHFCVQDYMSVPKKYYHPAEIGYEAKIKERIDYWDGIRKKHSEKENIKGKS